jgi:hypothetical protein
MRIIRARLKPFGVSAEFISVKGRIKAMIEKNKGDIFHFVIDQDGIKTVKEFGPDNINEELVGRTIPIIDDIYQAQFNEDGTIDVITTTNESLPRQETVNQLKKLRKMTRGTDIGDRISDMNKQGSNIQYIQNPIDTGIESYEDFEKHNKKFVPSWNLKHLKSPFRTDSKKTSSIKESKIYGIEILPEKALMELKDLYVDYEDTKNKIEVYPDPKVDGTFAVRIYRADDKYTFDLLWNKGGFDEVESDENPNGFSTWPPVSGELKFF